MAERARVHDPHVQDVRIVQAPRQRDAPAASARANGPCLPDRRPPLAARVDPKQADVDGARTASGCQPKLVTPPHGQPAVEAERVAGVRAQVSVMTRRTVGPNDGADGDAACGDEEAEAAVAAIRRRVRNGCGGCRVCRGDDGGGERGAPCSRSHAASTPAEPRLFRRATRARQASPLHPIAGRRCVGRRRRERATHASPLHTGGTFQPT